MAACSLENMDSIKYKAEGENGIIEKKFSIKEEVKEENYSSTVRNEIVTEEEKKHQLLLLKMKTKLRESRYRKNQHKRSLSR